MRQLALNLRPTNPYDLQYFVPHSGVFAAWELLDRAIKEVLNNKTQFRLIYLYGPAGSGKTHLLLGFTQLALADLEKNKIISYDDLIATKISIIRTLFRHLLQITKTSAPTEAYY